MQLPWMLVLCSWKKVFSFISPPEQIVSPQKLSPPGSVTLAEGGKEGKKEEGNEGREGRQIDRNVVIFTIPTLVSFNSKEQLYISGFLPRMRTLNMGSA